MPGRTKTLIWVIVGALALAFLMFAPVSTAGMHVEAGDLAKRHSREWQVSLLGLETTVWLWLGASGVFVAVAVAVLFAALAGRRSTQPGPGSGDGPGAV